MEINKKSFHISNHPILSRVWAFDLNGNEDPSQRGCKSNNMYKWICIGGGVSANSGVRNAISELK